MAFPSFQPLVRAFLPIGCLSYFEPVEALRSVMVGKASVKF